jgi:drug/metabolite transporter (DMT)-like permease
MVGPRDRMHTTTGRWRLGLGLTLGAVLMWGLLPVALKAVLRQMDAATISWYRFVGAAAVMAVPVIRSGELATLWRLRGTRLLILAAASLALSANYILYVVGLDHMPPGAAQVVIQLAPMFMLLGGLAVFGERFSRWQWMGLAAVVIGLLMFFHQNLASIFGAMSVLTRGLLFMVAAALAWAVYALSQKQLLKSFQSSTVLFVVYLTGTIVFLPVTKPSQILGLDVPGLWLLAFLAFNTLAAYGCFAEALDHLEASRIGIVIALTPLFTLTFVALGARYVPGIVDAEPRDPLSILGALLVVGGSMLGALSRGNDGPA